MPRKFTRRRRKSRKSSKYPKKRSTALTAKTFSKLYNSNYSNIYDKWIPAPFPTAMKIRATWAEKGYKLATVGTGQTIGQPVTLPLVRLNDAYDPFIVTGFGQESTRYNSIFNRYYGQYEVMYCVIKLSVRSSAPVTNTSDDLRFICGISDVPNQYPSQANQEEQCMFPGVQNALLETYNGNPKNRKDFYFKFNVSKWAKRTNQSISDISPISNASPTVSPVLWCTVANDYYQGAGLTNNATVNVEASIDMEAVFYVKYTDRKDDVVMRGN